LPIEFKPETVEDLRLPTPSNTQNYTQETAKESPATPKDISTNVDVEPSDQEVDVTLATIDTALITEIKKAMEVIQKIAPEDSLQKEEIAQKNIEQAKKNMADKARNFNEERQFYYDNYRAIYNLRKVYPYVLKTKEIVTQMNLDIAKVKSSGEKRKLIKKAEKQLFEQFEKDVRNMSTSQGKLLLKLIARETNQTAFGLIKTYKGAIPATFWYGVGLIFHENLKLQYDSIGEDAQLEKVVKKFKLGKL